MSYGSYVSLPVAAVISCLSVGVGRADQPAHRPAAESLVEAFVAICYLSVPDFSIVENMVKNFEYKNTTSSNSGSEGKTWSVNYLNELQITVSTSKGTLFDKPANICSVVEPRARVAEVVDDLNDQFNKKNLLGTQVNGGVRMTYWYGRTEGKSVLIELKDGTPSGNQQAGVKLSAMANPNGQNLLDP